jgi:hypothetical protein
MNSFNHLETQLRHWKLRPPSPKLRSTLFDQDVLASGWDLELKPLAWLAPVIGCLMLLVTLGSVMSLLKERASGHPATILLASDQEFEDSLKKAITTHLNSGQNVLQVAFFASTNTRSFPSSSSSFRLLTTNCLRN